MESEATQPGWGEQTMSLDEYMGIGETEQALHPVRLARVAHCLLDALSRIPPRDKVLQDIHLKDIQVHNIVNIGRYMLIRPTDPDDYSQYSDFKLSIEHLKAFLQLLYEVLARAVGHINTNNAEKNYKDNLFLYKKLQPEWFLYQHRWYLTEQEGEKFQAVCEWASTFLMTQAADNKEPSSDELGKRWKCLPSSVQRAIHSEFRAGWATTPSERADTWEDVRIFFTEVRSLEKPGFTIGGIEMFEDLVATLQQCIGDVEKNPVESCLFPADHARCIDEQAAIDEHRKLKSPDTSLMINSIEQRISDVGVMVEKMLPDNFGEVWETGFIAFAEDSWQQELLRHPIQPITARAPQPRSRSQSRSSSSRNSSRDSLSSRNASRRRLRTIEGRLATDDQDADQDEPRPQSKDGYRPLEFTNTVLAPATMEGFAKTLHFADSFLEHVPGEEDEEGVS